jgi:hypothetical protein
VEEKRTVDKTRGGGRDTGKEGKGKIVKRKTAERRRYKHNIFLSKGF